MAPIDFLHRLQSHFTKKSVEKPPPLTPAIAAALSVLYTVVYVVPFYLSKTAKPSPKLSRDAPSVIKTRIRAVTASCISLMILTAYIIVVFGEVTPWEAVRLLGWWPISIIDIAKSLLLVAVLFVGPLFEAGIVEGGWRDWIKGRDVYEVLSSWMGYRNFVVGPFTEELIWRSLLIALHLLCIPASAKAGTPVSMSPTRIIFTVPLYFGIAHIHHLYEFKLTHPHTPFLPCLLRSLFQFTYTSLFGFFASFLFLRTGSLAACVLAHSMCNWLGVPRVWGKVGHIEIDVEPGVPIGPPGNAVRGKEDSDGLWKGKKRESGETKVMIQTVMYYSLLFVGAFGFYWFLWPLTESTNQLVVV